MKITITASLMLVAFLAMGQNCQLVSLQQIIPAGISKHHFPAQEMPQASQQELFTLFSKWSEGDIVTRIRFSNDRENWTDWKVLKRDYTQPEAKHSPFFLVEDQFAYFEWSVYNKGGAESALSLDFYYPSTEPIMAEVTTAQQVVISPVGCPLPLLVDQSTHDESITTSRGRN